MAHEFKGRIARVEGRFQEAELELKAALEKDPKNVDAARELRLINMRKSDDNKEESKGLSGLLGGLFKR